MMVFVLRARGGSGRAPTASVLIALATFLALLGAAPAGAAPPANDNRVNAEPIPSFPATFAGTTAEATVELLDPQVSRCGPIRAPSGTASALPPTARPP